jgi:hypothetical protein
VKEERKWMSGEGRKSSLERFGTRIGSDLSMDEIDCIDVLPATIDPKGTCGKGNVEDNGVDADKCSNS